MASWMQKLTPMELAEREFPRNLVMFNEMLAEARRVRADECSYPVTLRPWWALANPWVMWRSDLRELAQRHLADMIVNEAWAGIVPDGYYSDTRPPLAVSSDGTIHVRLP